MLARVGDGMVWYGGKLNLVSSASYLGLLERGGGGNVMSVMRARQSAGPDGGLRTQQFLSM